MDSGAHSPAWFSVASWYQTSRPSCQFTDAPVRLTTRQVCTLGQACSAVSVFCLSGIARPPRTPSSAVMTVWQSESRILSFNASGENPPNTTECTAPIRVQASMA